MNIYLGRTKIVTHTIDDQQKLSFTKRLMMCCRPYILRRKIKKWTRAKKEALISGDFDMLQILAECRNATHYKYFDK